MATVPPGMWWGGQQRGGGVAAIRNTAEWPGNLSATRLRKRGELTGRPRAYNRKLKLSRIALRELGSKGLIPGIVKSSW